MRKRHEQIATELLGQAYASLDERAKKVRAMWRGGPRSPAI
jgi:hypothetical protein